MEACISQVNFIFFSLISLATAILHITFGGLALCHMRAGAGVVQEEAPGVKSQKNFHSFWPLIVVRPLQTTAQGLDPVPVLILPLDEQSLLFYQGASYINF